MISPIKKFFNDLTIRSKFTISISLIIALMIIALIIISNMQDERLNELLADTTIEKAETFDKLFELKSHHLEILIYNEYAHWTEMARFIYKYDENFARGNIDWLVRDYDFNSVWVYDSLFNEVYFTSDNLVTDNHLDLALLKAQIKKNRETKFYSIIGSNLIEFICTSVILTEDEVDSAVQYGYIVATRIIDEDYVNDLEKLYDCSITILYDINQKGDTGKDLSTISFTKSLFDLKNKPIAFYKIGLHSEIIMESVSSARNLFLIYAHISALILFLFTIIFFQNVSSPLKKIVGSLDSENITDLSHLAEKKDEFGKIANLIMKFLDQKSELEQQILQRETVETELQNLNKLLEKKVSSKSLELKALIEQAPFAIAMFDKAGKTIESNKFYKELFSLDDKPINSFALLKEIIYSNSKSDFDKLEELIRNGGEIYTLPIDMKLEKNEALNFDRRWLTFRFFSIKPDETEDIRIVSIIEDISENKKVEETEKKLTENEQLSLAIYNAQEEERKRVSTELHDSIGQKLSSVQMKLELYCKSEESNIDQLREIKGIIFSTGNELRNIIRNLHPADLDDYGLIKSVQLLCEEISNMTGIKVFFNAYEVPDVIDPIIQLNIYRIIQEALNNVSKHSQASEASVQIYYRDKFLLVNIEDNGQGINFEIQDISNLKSSYGLLNMKRRTETLNGNFYIDSSESLGTEIHIKIPWG